MEPGKEPKCPGKPFPLLLVTQGSSFLHIQQKKNSLEMVKVEAHVRGYQNPFWIAKKDSFAHRNAHSLSSRVTFVSSVVHGGLCLVHRDS